MKYLEYQQNNSQNFRFFVREWIPEIQPAGLVLLLHGLSDHGSRFEYVAEKFVKAGFVFVAPDLRGNGKSDGKRGHFDSLDQVMDDISFLLKECRKLHPGIPIVLYSQSMGGNLAINYTLRFPENVHCTVASSPWLRLTKQPPQPLIWLVSKLARFFPGLVIPNGLNPKDLCHDNQISQAYANDKLIHFKISLSTFININESGEWAIRNASKLKVPLLLLHSDVDPITSFTASREFKQNSNSQVSFLTFGGLYHELHNEPGEKEMIVAQIVEWVKLQTLPA